MAAVAMAVPVLALVLVVLVVGGGGGDDDDSWLHFASGS